MSTLGPMTQTGAGAIADDLNLWHAFHTTPSAAIITAAATRIVFP
jgi:hypothetical protein